MAITYTVNTVDNSTAGTTIVSGTLTIVATSVITVICTTADNNLFGTLSISNSGTALSWNPIVITNTANNCKVAGWWAFGDANGNRTVTVTHFSVSTGLPRRLNSIVHTGADQTTPVPAGKVLSGVSTTDVSRTMTPTDANGSALWMACGDWGQTNTFAALTNCSKEVADSNITGQYTTCLLRPTTQPRTDGSAFTLGETDTGGTIAFIAFEVVSDVGAPPPPPEEVTNLMPQIWM
jgi:hypothetical protein